MKRFVIGSGRCGSTLLTNMLAMHPDVLVLSEFFSTLDRTECFSKEVVTGAYFAEFLSRSNPIADITIRRGKGAKEILSDTTGLETLPALLIATLPMLTAKPEVLYREVIEAAVGFPRQPFAKHYLSLFDWLMKRLEKSYWVERSGPSNEYLPDLVEMFPDALYVHLHRDGPEAALSMSQHTYFQLTASFFFNPADQAEIEATEYAGKPVSDTDPFTKRLTSDLLPPEKFGEYWSYQQTMGFRGLARLNPAQVLEVCFEDLVSKPDDVMVKVSTFFGLPEREHWIDAAADLVTGMPPSRLDRLSPAFRAAMTQACHTGQLLLGRTESPWIKPSLAAIKDVSRRFNP